MTTKNPLLWGKDFVTNFIAKIHEFENRITAIEQTFNLWNKYMASKFDASGNLVPDTTSITGRATYTALSAIDGTTTPKFVCFDPAGTGKVQYCQKTANAIAFTDATVDPAATAMWVAVADVTTTSLTTNASGSFVIPSYGTVSGFSGLIPGEKYFISANGTAVVYASLSSNDWTCYVGVAASATSMRLEHGSVPFQKP